MSAPSIEINAVQQLRQTTETELFTHFGQRRNVKKIKRYEKQDQLEKIHEHKDKVI